LQSPRFFDDKTVGAALNQIGALFFRDNFTADIRGFFKKLNLDFSIIFPGLERELIGCGQSGNTAADNGNLPR